MEFKDLLKVLEEYYAKATEVAEVRRKWFDHKVQIKSGKCQTQNDSRYGMKTFQDSITGNIDYIFSIYGDSDNVDFTILKDNVNNFIEFANMWLDCFEENKGE